jgi:hypothetical protein
LSSGALDKEMSIETKPPLSQSARWYAVK